MYQAYAQELLNQKEFETDAAMPDDSQPPLYVATRRLVGALNLLEQKLEKLNTRPKNDAASAQQMLVFERENETLRRERENLNAAIGQLEHQYQDLHQVASAIYGKHDDSIKRLSQIIEN